MRLSGSLREWLLGDESDPSVRYRVLRELLDRPPDDPEILDARKEIGRRGWAERLLRFQHPDGHWVTPGSTADELYRPKYSATNWRLLALSDLGVPGSNPKVRKAIRLFVRRFRQPSGRLSYGAGEVCFTGNTVRMLHLFGHGKVPSIPRDLDWLVRHQKRDGGWHCFPSKTGTLDCWEALSAFAAVPPSDRSPAIQRAIERGAEFYLRRGLLREGRTPYAPWLRLHFPVHYYYDFLVGLDVLTSLGYGRDPRIRPALARLVKMRNRDGTWTMDALHPDTEDPNYQWRVPFFPLGIEVAGRPSRWITTTALAVLKRARY